MKKNFPLKAPGKEDARVRDKIRHEINKYVRRERKKTVPEGFQIHPTLYIFGEQLAVKPA